VIEGADLIRLDEHEKVSEISVLIRPLVNIAVFGSAIGPALAARRGSKARAAVTRGLNAPLKVMFSCVDRIASRLLGLG
jgi:hypothetical protein